jgi:plastocyanin
MIMDFQYSPATATIAAGGMVTWTNHDSAPHTVTAADGSFDSGMMRTGGTWSRTFATPGVYSYRCDYHPEMVATVVVLAPGATAPPAGTPTTVAGGGSGGGQATTLPPAGSGGGSTGGGGGSTGGGASLPTTGSVAIAGNAFTPATITVAVGGTITWTNNDAVPHTVTADDDSFDSGIMRKGVTWSKTFSAPGTYTYFCTLHPEMRGTVVVATPDDPAPAVVTGGGSNNARATSTGGGGAVGSAASGSSAGGATAAGSATVTMANNQFSPVSVEVGLGGVVVWTNTDTIPHTVTADDASFDSDIMLPGDTFSHRFETAGTVSYRCTLHTGMTGQVVVSELPADAAAAAAASAGAIESGASDVAVPAESPDRVISITGDTFPAVTVLAAGHSVTWRNDDTVTHVVKALSGEFESDDLATGAEFTFTFDEPGVHPYTCDLHRHMGGTIIVMPADDVDLANSPTVAVTDTGFEPANLTVHQGTTVVWAFGGKLPHTVTADDGSFDSGVLDPGATFTFTFDELGEFGYTCVLHPAMIGTITVVPADEAIDAAGDESSTDAAAAPPTGSERDEPDSGGIGSPILVGLGVGGGLFLSVLVALGVALISRKSEHAFA